MEPLSNLDPLSERMEKSLTPGQLHKFIVDARSVMIEADEETMCFPSDS